MDIALPKPLPTPSYRNKELQALPALAYASFSEAETMDIMKAIVDNSRFLHQVLTNPDNQAYIENLFTKPPQVFCADLRAELVTFHETNLSYGALKKTLRLLRNRSMLSIAIADIVGFLSLKESTALLSDLAEYSVKIALTFLLRQARGNKLFTQEKSEDDSIEKLEEGYCILGMGKLGAKELNFSSDIDLIVLYDGQKIGIKNAERTQEVMNNVTRKLCALLSDKTSDGQVFRTDLRLRPDPSSHPIAINTTTASIYYEKHGKNWERGAMLKARVIAGDKILGSEFLQDLKPFIWRRNLDFDAIRDIFFLQEQRACRKGVIAIPGCNIKLSEGGIRDIEFFVQSLQLVWGGRKPQLRCLRTDDALQALLKGNFISRGDYSLLLKSYETLRHLEHRLQMLGDEQTHTIPNNSERLENLALFCGFKGSSDFQNELLNLMQRVWALFRLQVQTHSPKTVEQDLTTNVTKKGNSRKNSNRESNFRQLLASLLWHENEPRQDKDELTSMLEKMGYNNGENVVRIIQNWYENQTKHATNVSISQRFFLDVVPELLHHVADSLNPQGTITRFNKFVSKLPIGFPLFSIFGSHPHVLHLIASIITTAPRIIDYLAARPVLIDALLAGEHAPTSGEHDAIKQELSLSLQDAKDDEDVLILSRRFLHEYQFRSELAWLEGKISQEDALVEYTKFSEIILSRTIEQTENSYQGQQQNFAAWGFGRLGGKALLPQSDYDLVFVYKEGEEGANDSLFQEYQRLVRKVISFVESKTQEGILGKIDLRLRPYGKTGALVQSIDSVRSYYLERSAWLVEYMALSRARVIYASDEIAGLLRDIREQSLRLGFHRSDLATEVRNVLHLSHIEHGSDSTTNIKYRKGGLFDLEFLVQYRLLLAADKLLSKTIPYDVLGQITLLAKEEYLPLEDADHLKKAWSLMTGLIAFQRLTGSDITINRENPTIDKALRQMLSMDAKTTVKTTIHDVERNCEEIHAMMVKEEIAPQS